MRTVAAPLTLLLALVFVSSAWSAEERKGGEGRRSGARFSGFSDFFIKAIEGLDLTADQKAKLEEIKKESAEVNKKREGVLTQEQKDASKKAREEAEKAGKSRRDAFRAGMEAVKLTDEQKAKYAEIAKQGEQIRQKLMGLLTDEQKAALKAKMPQRGEKRKPESK